MFTFTRSKPFLCIFTCILIIISIILKPKLIDLFYLPLEITSSFITDTKAIITYKFILSENIKLKNELDQLKVFISSSKELTLENQRLKKLLSFKEQLSFSTISARVIGRDPNNWSKGLLIDKGTQSGVRVGSVVIAEAGLVGRIIEASGNVSKVILMNDYNSAVSALIERTRDEGLVSGTLLGEVVMRYLDKESDVQIADTIVTSGSTRNYPGGILIGRVNAVKEQAQGLGKYCIVSPCADLKRIEEVLVIVK